MQVTVSKYQLQGPGNTLSEQAVLKALRHYEAEAKDDKEYAAAMAAGLSTAVKELEKYHAFVDMITVK